MRPGERIAVETVDAFDGQNHPFALAIGQPQLGDVDVERAAKRCQQTWCRVVEILRLSEHPDHRLLRRCAPLRLAQRGDVLDGDKNDGRAARLL